MNLASNDKDNFFIANWDDKLVTYVFLSVVKKGKETAGLTL